MSESKIKRDRDALEAIQRGVTELAETVGKTLGPKGRNVVLRKKRQVGNGLTESYFQVTKDGVTVARHVNLTDPYENAGAQMVKGAAEKTNQIAGDGTTTSTVLAQAIVNAGIKNIAAGANPMDLKRGIELAVAKVVLHLKENSIPVAGDFGVIKHVGTVSANNDEAIGQLIADTMEAIGEDGVIYVEESRLPYDKVEIIAGVQVNQGYISPYFINDSARATCTLEKPYILLYDGKLTGIAPLLPLIQAIGEANHQNKEKRPLLIIAEEVSGETLAALIHNNNNGSFPCCAINNPFGENAKDIVGDIAIATGSDYISEDRGLKLEYALIDHLGTCEKVIVGEALTTIIGGGGDKDEVSDHISDLKSLREDAQSTFEREILTDRIAKLSKGVAVLYVGGKTEVEMREKKDRVEDALNATRAAMEEGIVPGGGVAYIRAISFLDNCIVHNDQLTGWNIVRECLEAPLRVICENGALKADVIINEVKTMAAHYGFNAREECYGNLVEWGIIDPTKVSRVALENAASVACIILTTSSIVLD